MNTITLVGSVSRPPEDVITPNGKTFSVFSVEDKNDFDKYPSYAKVLVFGSMRDKLQQVVKDALVCVVGKAKAEGYLGKRDSKPKASLSIVANSITVLAVFNAPEEQQQAPVVQGGAPQPTGNPAPTDGGDNQEDVPF